MTRVPGILGRVLAVALLLASPLAVEFDAQSTTPDSSTRDSLLDVSNYLDYEQVSSPRIAPDGSQIIYTRRFVDRMNDRWESALWIMDADGDRNRFLTKGGNAVWSPDSRRIAYIADGEPEGAGGQLFVRWVESDGAGTQITHTNAASTPIEPRWSPDGSRIGFAMFTPAAQSWKIDMPAAPKGAKWTAPPRYVNSLHYRADRRGFLEPGYVHLFVVPADGGTPRALTSGEWSVGARFDGLPGSVGWDWAPDGQTIIVDGFADSTADHNYRASHLYSIDIATGARRQVTAEPGSWSNPAIAPDGRSIAFVGHAATDASYQAAAIWLMDRGQGGVRKMSGELDRDPSELTWARDGSGVYFTVGDSGTSNVYFAGTTGTVRKVTHGEHMLSLGSVAANGTAVGVRSAFQEPPDVVRFSLRQPDRLTTLTHVNDDLLHGVTLAAVEEIRYPSSGGAFVQGWIVKPPGFDPARTYPLILEIHGGPHGMYGMGFNFMFQTFAANDFVVLYTNPRGSTGYGSAFGNAIERAYPSVDYDDLMAGVDEVIGRGYVDTTRMFVGGCSGGGVLSSWVIGHTDRFAAAAVRCPVTNWLSFAGQTDIPLFTYNFFDAPFWEEPERWIRQSPLAYVGNVTTPTLVMTGELDMRTPMPQSEEYYAALKMRGVPAALLRFEGEYHGTGSKPSNYMRTQLYMMDWYKQWGGAKRWKPVATENAMARPAP